MRLDKFMSLCGRASRTETARAVRGGEILVGGVPAGRADMQIDPDTDEILFRGEAVVYHAFTYVLMHKPDGVVSATEDRLRGEQTVLDLLPLDVTRVRPALFPCGRLDKHTTGLILLTNNGQLSHRLLSPRSHVDKTYTFTVKFPLSDGDITALETGVDIGGYVTAPCTVVPDEPDTEGKCRSGRITLHEGKYHQIKRMMEARHNQLRTLCRVSFGPLTLDPALMPGEWRYLTKEETDALEACGK